MRADLVERKLLELEKKAEKEEKYNFIVDQSFLIIYPVLAITLFAIYLGQNSFVINNYLEGLELLLYSLITVIFTYLVSNSRPIKIFIMEWYLLKNIAELETSFPSKKELGKFTVATIISATMVLVTIYFDIIPIQYSFIIVYLIAFIVSFLILQISSLINAKNFKTNLRVVTQIRGNWKTMVRFNLALSGFVLWIVSGIIIGTL